LTTVIAAFESIDNARLVLAGPGTERYSSPPNVQGLGWIEDRALVDLLAQADLVVNASLHEGFGLPALEALSWGVPVILSAIPAFIEVAGDAAEFVTEPLSPLAWAKAINGLLSDPGRRAALVAAGARQAEERTWTVVAGEMKDLLVSLAPGTPPVEV
jgi:glycosyltransferase involved in cell wall biosynthesis